jgi:hypothetical protein
MGTEWGLGPFTIEKTTQDVTAIHAWPRAGSEGDGYVSPPAAGSGPER